MYNLPLSHSSVFLISARKFKPTEFVIVEDDAICIIQSNNVIFLFELLPTENNSVYICYVILQHLNKQMLKNTKLWVQQNTFWMTLWMSFRFVLVMLHFIQCVKNHNIVSLPINHIEGWFNLKFWFGSTKHNLITNRPNKLFLKLP